LAEAPEIGRFLDRRALGKLLDPISGVGNAGAMVDRVLDGEPGDRR